jgi:hypothetical protein
MSGWGGGNIPVGAVGGRNGGGGRAWAAERRCYYQRQQTAANRPALQANSPQMVLYQASGSFST